MDKQFQSEKVYCPRFCEFTEKETLIINQLIPFKD